MTDKYKLKSGQINFESTNVPGSYLPVIFKNGEWHNLTDETRAILIAALTEKTEEKVNIEDMF